MKHEIARRRTFAIISHPDAGKTTLTEKLLLYGGVIQLAGAVKAKRGRASAVSDWMEMERERGISITTSVLQFPYRGLQMNLLDTPGHADFSEDTYRTLHAVLQFPYRGLQMNLLDTPGHADFSEDTYRTLHAVDGAVMLLDSAKGVEAQTRKLFRVCRQRAIPIFTFVNKLDRPGRDAFDLIGEVENVLGIGVYPVTWPIFRSGVFRGVYHRLRQRVYLFEANRANSSSTSGAERPPVEVTGIDDPALREELDDVGYDRLRHDAELLEMAGDGFDRERFEAGQLSPMFFGSAVNNFGLEAFLETFSELMPPPRARASDAGPIEPSREEFSGFVF
ncbi:MAG: peptide chain release factor 3, partial [Anaeromyxobacteraceae bacterium]|nr:peptide chain release factor 3 [Anaeromyxobacteraceae bacterium]